MTNSELLAWCEDHDFPVKLAALLSVWTPDLDELEEWNITDDGGNLFTVNDTQYVVLDELEYSEAEDNTRDAIIEYLSEDIPESVLPFIDWDSYFYRHEIGIEDVLPEGDSVLFEKEYYYYGVV